MKICYFGTYSPDFGRNKIYIKGLRQLGHEVVECWDTSPGLIKFFKLWQKHRALKGGYDFLVVGYPGQLATPLAKLLSQKKVVVDALGSLYDAEANSHYPNLVRKIKSRLLDWLMVKLADKILLESYTQKSYFIAKFGPSAKYEVVYTGADVNFEGGVKTEQVKHDCFQVLFRGKLTPESGILTILQAAKLLVNEEQIKFKIIGTGYLLKPAQDFIASEKLINVELIDKFLPNDELVVMMREASLMLGQFADNPRLNRTIPHKAFEALALGIPYVSGDTPAIREIIPDGETGFFVPLANPKALADKLRVLVSEPELLIKVGTRARTLFKEKYTSKILAAEIIKVL